MEFKYRSVDVRPPPPTMPYRSHPPFIGRFSTEQHAAQRGPPNYSPNKYRNDVGVTTLWDVNKERIKGGIIGKEFVQGRILESEVMMMGRETTMRREMGMDGAYFRENRSMLSNSRFSMNHIENHYARLDYGGTFSVLRSMAPIPNAFGGEVKYSPEANDKKDKLIVTAMPNQNKVGSKREAVTPPISNADEPILYGNNKRAKQDWSSALHEVSATCEITSSAVPMELVYRDMSPALVAYRSPSLGVNFFTEQVAPRAINAIPSYYPQYCDDVGGTIPWDVKREQIKRVIVSEELVRREMAMGGRSSFHESRPLLFNSRFSSMNHFENHQHEEKVALDSHGSGFNALPPMPLYPNGREVKSSPEVNGKKDKLIMLARPDLNNAGSKRKAATPPAPDDDKPALSVNKKRANEEWSCALCQVSATSESTFKEHLCGKKHKANETTLKLKTRKPSLKTKAKKLLSRQQRKNGIVSDNRQDVSLKKDESVTSWRCALCQVSATSKSSFYEHLQGKKHKTKEAGLGCNELKPLPMSGLVTETKVVKELLQQSLTRDDSGLKSINRENNNVGNKTEKIARTGKHKFWCEVCKIGAHVENVMEDHIRGKKHKFRLLQKLAPNNEPKNL